MAAASDRSRGRADRGVARPTRPTNVDRRVLDPVRSNQRPGHLSEAEDEIVRERLESDPGRAVRDGESVAEVAVFIATARGMHLNGRRVWTTGFVDERDARAPTEEPAS